MGPRVKPSAGGDSIVDVVLDVGDWLDVMDAEGTWNVAQVLRVVNTKEVEVKYDGWGAEYNEVVLLNSDRVAPYHTYTWSVVCWAKYKNWPWWPSIVTIRSPGTVAGQKYLENEKRLFVDFMDGKDITKRCRCWIEQSKVQPFSKLEDERRKRSTGSDFEASLGRVHLSSASKTFPKFAKGTLPVQYRSEIAAVANAMRKEMGLKQWARAINSNKERHRRVYMYKLADGMALTDDEEDDGDEGQVVQFADLSDGDNDVPKKPRAASKAKALAKNKSVKKEPSSKSPKSKQATNLADSVVKIEDSADIIEGPHAPSPKREPEAQPLYLPPLDEQIGAGAPPSSDEAAGQHPRPRRGAQTSVSSAPAVQVSRKRKSREPSENSSIDATQVLEPAAGRNERDTIVDDHLGDGGDYVFEPGATTVEKDSQETMPAGPLASSKDPVRHDVRDRALVLDINENDDSDAESDLVPLDPVDDVGVESALDAARVVQPCQTEVVGAPASSQQVTSTEKPEANHTAATQDSVTSTVDEAPHEVQRVAAAVIQPEGAHSVVESLSTTLHVDVAKVPQKPPKLPRKSSKSLADETIAAAQAALAELDHKPAPSKKMRTDKSGKSSSSGSAAKSATVTKARCVKAAGVPSKGPVDSGTNSGVSPTLVTKEACEPQSEAIGAARDQDNQGTTRRSSMRAAAEVTPGDGQRKIKGKTPVWVLPPPKFDPSSVYGSSPLSTTSILSAPVFPPPFSSLSLFGSTVDFSMSKWFKQDKYPHYLSQ